jgi:hypothetical protein
MASITVSRRDRWILRALLLTVVSGGACGACNRHGPAAKAFVASCDKRDVMSQCEDYQAAALDGGQGHTVREGCRVVRGTFQSNPCPQGNTLIGSCDFLSLTRHYYAEGALPFQTKSARKDCVVAEGTWRSP